MDTHHQSLRQEQQQVETSLTPRERSAAGREGVLREDPYVVGGHQNSNNLALRHNHSTVSKTSISSFRRSQEPSNIKEEVQDASQTTDLDTLILKAQQNYALSKQVIDKITGSKEQAHPGGQQPAGNFANLMDGRSTLTGRQNELGEDQYVNATHRHHLLSQGHQPRAGNIGLSQQLSDNDTHETNKRQACEEYYSLKPQPPMPESSIERLSYSNHHLAQPEPKQGDSSCENSPTAMNRDSSLEKNENVNQLPRRDANNGGIMSQGSIVSNLYVQTEAPVSDRQPPEVLRDHLIHNLGFKAEPLPQVHSQREQMQEYNEQMEQLKKLQEKFSSQKYLRLNQNSGNISPMAEEEQASADVSVHEQSNATMRVQDGDDVHTFNRKHQARAKHIDSENRAKCSPSPLNHDNSRVDTGHFNSKSGGLYHNSDMNIMSSLNMDASPNGSQSPSSPVVSSGGHKGKDTTMIMLKKPIQKPDKEKYNSKYQAYANTEDQRNHSKEQSYENSLQYMAQMSDHSSRDNDNTETYRVSNDGADVDHRYHQINQTDQVAQQPPPQYDPNRSIPSSIHSLDQHEERNPSEATIFSMQLQKLYDNITIICPKFGIETGEATSSNRIEVSPELQHHSPVLAIQLYNQVCYLYQQVKDLKLASLKKGDGQAKGEDMQLTSQLQLENNMLKLQADNLQRETDFYKGQAEMLQEQLRVSTFKNQPGPNVEGLMHDLTSLEARNAELQEHIKQLEGQNQHLGEQNMHLEQRNQSLQNQQALMAEQHRSEQQAAIPQEYVDLMNRKNENQERLTQLTVDNRELKSKLKMQEEIANFEKELNQTLKKQLEGLQDGKRKEIEQLKKDISRLQDTILQKNKTIQSMTQQIDDFASLVSLEFPLFSLTPPKKEPLHFHQNSINLSNQNKQPKFVSMTRDTNNEAVMGLLNEFDTVMGFGEPMASFEFETTDNRQKRQGAGNIGGLRGKSSNQRMAKKKRNSSQSQAQHQYDKLFNLPQMIEQQIATAIFTDHVLKDHKASLDKKNKRIDEQLGYVKQIEDKMLQFKKQKDEFAKNQKELTKDNEELKVKFSLLLDQFQEYVNESEKKTEEEQTQQKEIQEKLLNDLNCTIRELEEMSQNLQRESEEKDQIISDMQKERDILQKDMTYLKERFKQAEEHKEQLQSVKIQSLNEEINYLKKHYMVELDVLQQENKNLRMKIRAQSAKGGEYNEGRASHSPYGRVPVHAPDQQSSFDRQMSSFPVNDSSHRIYGPQNFNGCGDQDSHENTAFLSKNIIESTEQSRYQGLKYPRDSSGHRQRRADARPGGDFDRTIGDNSRSRGRDPTQQYNDAEDRIYPGNRSGSGQPGYHNLRSKSHDRALGSGNAPLLDEQQQHEQNQGYHHKNWNEQTGDEAGGGRGNFSAAKSPNHSQFRNNKGARCDFSDQQELSYGQSRHRMANRGGPAPRSQSLESKERSHMTGDDQVLRNNEILLLSAKKENKMLNNLKQELDEKQQLIEFQNQEIVQLRFEFEEFKGKANQMDMNAVSQMQRSRLLMDIDGVTETLRSELERVKVNLWNEQSHYDHDRANEQLMNITNNVVREIDEEIHAVKSEDKLLSMLTGRVKKMNRLLSLSSEILLLSTKQKYMPQQMRYSGSQVQASAYKQGQDSSPILIQNQNKQPSDASGHPRSQMSFQETGLAGPNQGVHTSSTVKQANVDDEALIDENNSLKRTVYKYENTLAQLDSIFRRDNDKEECIYELKKLTEGQLHQILRLQKEVDGQDRRRKEERREVAKIEEENGVLKQEISMLRERLAQHEIQHQNKGDQQTGYTQQLASIEQQLQDKSTQLNDALAGLKERDAQFDEIRSRITVVAELFEKKAIKQRYSFEVLCDFIHDKAKRLFAKYENALKEKKQFNEDKVSYYHRKISALEGENDKGKEARDLIRLHIVPKLQQLLQKTGSHPQAPDRASPSLVRELLDDLAFQFTKLQQANTRMNSQTMQNQDKVKHLQALLDQHGSSSLATQSFHQQTSKLRDRSPPPMMMSPNGAQGPGPGAQPDEQRAELDRMKQEKTEMNQKLEEFAQIMRDFQVNQQMQAEENGQLKMKIDQLENAKRGGNILASKDEPYNNGDNLY